MASKKNTKRPEFPIFWTYLTDANGVKTIHQVKFIHLIVVAKNNYNEIKDTFSSTDIYFTAFEIAGKDGVFTNRKDLEGFQYHDLGCVYSTREKVEEEIKAIDFSNVNLDTLRDFLTGAYISQSCPLNRCYFSWFNNLPNELELEIGKVVYPAGAWWNGLYGIYDMAKVNYTGVNVGGLEPINDKDLHNKPLYDMVTNNWLGTWQHKYYKFLDDCEKDNETKVYTFS